MVVKQLQDGGRLFFENRYIAISQWIVIGFTWNFVHSSKLWTGWTSRDQKWKGCIGQTPSSTERISCWQEYSESVNSLQCCGLVSVLLAPSPTAMHKLLLWRVLAHRRPCSCRRRSTCLELFSSRSAPIPDYFQNTSEVTSVTVKFQLRGSITVLSIW